MTPDNEETIRTKLRHLRTALNHVQLAHDVGWFQNDAIDGVEIDLRRLIEIVHDELERMRNL